MDLETLQAIDELKAMSFEELDKVPFDVVRWQCKVKFCKCYTRLRDYGVATLYFHKHGVTDIKTGELRKWIDITNRFFLCAKHSKRYKDKELCDIPLKKHSNGNLVFGVDYTGKQTILI